MSTGVRIVDLPDLGAVSTGSHFVGEKSGSGAFSATSMRDYLFYDPIAALSNVTGERHVALARNSALSPWDLYNAIFPGVTDFHTLGAVLDVPVGSVTDNASAVCGFVRERSGAVNGVTLQGIGTAEASTSAVWGVNTLLQDNATRTVGSGGSRVLLGAELDFNVMNASTQVIGVSVGGNSLAQSGNASAYIVNGLGADGGGNPYKWNVGLLMLDGCATVGVSIGTASKIGTANDDSAPLWFSIQDSAAAKQTVIVKGKPTGSPGIGLLEISNAAYLKINGGHLLLDSNKNLIVNGLPVVGDRKTGWVVGTGTPVRNIAVNFNYTQTLDPTYSQPQVQAIQSFATQIAQRLMALEADIRAHGLIN